MSSQVEFLHRLARRNEVSLSRAVASIIEQNADVPEGGRAPVQAPLCVTISPEHLTILGRWAVKLGLSRSDVARRLIDGALQREG